MERRWDEADGVVQSRDASMFRGRKSEVVVCYGNAKVWACAWIDGASGKVSMTHQAKTCICYNFVGKLGKLDDVNSEICKYMLAGLWRMEMFDSSRPEAEKS